MPKWVDYQKLRQDLKFEDLLESYNIQINESNRQHKGPCPLPDCRELGDRKDTFSANLERGIWQCFRCGNHGNQVEFGVMMEGFDPDDRRQFRKAALILAEKFGLARENNNRNYRKPRERKPKQCNEPPQPVKEEVINAPLDFQLNTLDPNYEWFAQQGLRLETVEWFGLGYCSRGYLKGRIAIPLRDRIGQLVGYAGLLLSPKIVKHGNPLILYPKTKVREGLRHIFDPSEILYNADRIPQNPQTLIVTEDFLALWRVWQDGCRNVVCVLTDQWTKSEQAIEGLLDEGVSYRLIDNTSP